MTKILNDAATRGHAFRAAHGHPDTQDVIYAAHLDALARVHPLIRFFAWRSFRNAAYTR